MHGDLLATASSDQSIKIWRRTKSGFELEDTLVAHAGSISRLSWSHPSFGTLLASASTDRQVFIYQRNASGQWKRRGRLADARGAVTGVAFSPGHLNLMVAACSTDGHTRIYECRDLQNLSDWRLLWDVEVSDHSCEAVSWNPSPFEPISFVVAAQKTARIYDVQTANVSKITPAVVELIGHTDIIHDVAWAPPCGRSRHRIATACKDGAVRVYSLQYTGKMSSSNEQNDSGNNAAAIESSPFNLWSKPQLLLTSTSHDSPVWRVSWNLTGSLLASTGDDGTAKMYQSNYHGEMLEILSVAT